MPAIALTLAAGLIGGGYTVVGGWTCDAPGLLRRLDAMDKNEKWSDSFKRNYQAASCMPMLATYPAKVSVIAFQGDYAFVCQILNPKDIGGPYDLPTYNCTYAMTKHLRDAKGRAPASQVSKVSPSPSFFDNARKLDFSGIE